VDVNVRQVGRGDGTGSESYRMMEFCISNDESSGSVTRQLTLQPYTVTRFRHCICCLKLIQDL
jgi:hypothetical protein